MGLPVRDDRRLFEKLCLEGFQSGLSWLTILRKREASGRPSATSTPSRSRASTPDVERLLTDAGIVRHRGKIQATINNARRASSWWRSTARWPRSCGGTSPPVDPAGAARRGRAGDHVDVAGVAGAVEGPEARGWTFVGPTTVYAFMQAMGLVNDHLDTCFVRPAVQSGAAAIAPPGGDAVTG